jgi:hypothetical protein
MIDKIFTFLKDGLNVYLTSGRAPDDPHQEPQVAFYEWNNDFLNFKSGTVSILLINLEQENILRAEDTFKRTLADGTVQKGHPEIRLNLFLLFVPHYPKYEDTLRKLSDIIQYFQSRRLLNHQNSPELGEDVGQLVIELVSLSFSEQNEIWGALRLTYHPSVLYKVKMVVFGDEDISASVPVVKERIIGLSG